jgi:hypothetical protein
MYLFARCKKSAALSAIVSGIAFGQAHAVETLAGQDSAAVQVAGKQSQELVTEKSSEPGFFDGSHLDVLERLYFRSLSGIDPKLTFARDGDDGTPSFYQKNSAALATLGSTVNFRSGYTQGVVGFGLDLSAMNGTTLYGDQDTTSLSADMANTDSFGRPNRNWSKMAVADAKLKISDTELKVGRQIIDSPLLHSNYNRTFPASFTGATLVSNDIESYKVKAGTVTKVVGRNSTNEEGLSLSYAPSVKFDRASYAGFDYSGADDFSATVATTLLEDTLVQYLAEAKQNFKWSPTLHLTPEVALYHSEGTGKALAGDDSVSMAIIGLTGEWGGNSLTAKYQQVFGDTFYDYLLETNSISYSNTMYSDYQGPREKSLQLLYKHDFVADGVPGLLLYAWAISGWDIDGSHYGRGVYKGMLDGVDNARHHEVGISPTYVVQSGDFKGASVRVGYVVHRQSGGQITGDANEFLLVGELPFKIF